MPEMPKRGSGLVSQFSSTDRPGVGGQQGDAVGIGSSPTRHDGTGDVRPRTRIVPVGPVRWMSLIELVIVVFD
ncbi:hypothetical protein Droror1_Dr00010971 [Drosera rotundifolia]